MGPSLMNEGFGIQNGTRTPGKENHEMHCSPVFSSVKVSRRQLSDVSNANLSVHPGSLKCPERIYERTSDLTINAHLQKEISFLKACLTEKEVILESTKHELQKILCQYYKTMEQNRQLAHKNGQIFADLCMVQDKYKTLLHEHNLMAATFKLKRTELEKKVEELSKQLEKKFDNQLGPERERNNTRLHTLAHIRAHPNGKKEDAKPKRVRAVKLEADKLDPNPCSVEEPESTCDVSAASSQQSKCDKPMAMDREETPMDTQSPNHSFNEALDAQGIEHHSSSCHSSSAISKDGPNNCKVLRKRNSIKGRPAYVSRKEAYLKAKRGQIKSTSYEDANGDSTMGMQNNEERKSSKRRLKKANDDSQAFNGSETAKEITAVQSVLEQSHPKTNKFLDELREVKRTSNVDYDSAKKFSACMDVSAGHDLSGIGNSSVADQLKKHKILPEKRQSLRRRSANICYKEPSLNRKLRQSDPACPLNFFVREEGFESKLPREGYHLSLNFDQFGASVEQDREVDKKPMVRQKDKEQEALYQPSTSNQVAGEVCQSFVLTQTEKIDNKSNLKQEKANNETDQCHPSSNVSFETDRRPKVKQQKAGTETHQCHPSSSNVSLKSDGTPKVKQPKENTETNQSQPSLSNELFEMDSGPKVKQQEENTETNQGHPSLSSLSFESDGKSEAKQESHPYPSGVSFDFPGGPKRSSSGRPVRRATEAVNSYKEIPVNIKMRRDH